MEHSPEPGRQALTGEELHRAELDRIEQGRRQWLRRRTRMRRLTRRGLLGLAGLGATGWALGEWGSRGWPVARRRTVELEGLPSSLDGFCIAQISDLHASELTPALHLERGIALVRSLKPDLIALTGDYVTETAAFLSRARHLLRRLQAPHGVLAVLGNHDYWCGKLDAVANSLRDSGIEVLVNQSKAIGGPAGRLWLGGVDDVWSGRPDPEETFRKAGDGLRLLLCHEPDYVDELAGHRVALQLSGHTHGGQIRLPGIGALVRPRYGENYDLGLQRSRDGRTLLYTNAGLGVIFPPIRINCPPEVTLLTLRGVGRRE